jgi:hypothetical protein
MSAFSDANSSSDKGGNNWYGWLAAMRFAIGRTFEMTMAL